MDTNQTITVSELNECIRLFLDNEPLLHRLYVRGEISNFTNHRSGHLYFTLKDENSLIKSVMFKTYAQKLKFRPENGMRVVVRGKVSVFVRDGQYQLYAEDIEPDGVGALYVAYEQLKSKLEAEGLFDINRKRKLPHFPRRIGIITSPTGAAIQDMINITGRRFPSAELVIYPSAVQGSEAPGQLLSGVEYFSRTKCVDVVIIGRGGGSLEDLWAFNNEQLARAVASSAVPIISAVGHETDYTICDFAADCRAPTPSAAAELAVPDSRDLLSDFSDLKNRIGMLLSRKITDNRAELSRLSSARVITDSGRLLDGKRQALDRAADRLDAALTATVGSSRADLREIAAKLGSLNPLAVLSRGFASVSDTDGKCVTGVSKLKTGDTVIIRFSDGRAVAGITETEENYGQ